MVPKPSKKDEDNPFRGVPVLSFICFWESGLLMPPTTCNHRTICLTTGHVSHWVTGLRWNIVNNYLNLTFEVCCTSN